MTIIDVFNKVSVVTATLPGILSLSRGVRGPQGQIVSQQLHDQGAVLVAVLVQSVQLSNGIIKCLQKTVVTPGLSNKMVRGYLLSELTRLIRGGHDFVVENREIQSQAQSDGMSGLHGRFCNVEGILVGLLGVINHGFPGITIGNLGQVAVVVSLHLQVEHLRLSVAGLNRAVSRRTPVLQSVTLAMRNLSRRPRTSLQMSLSSFSTFSRYSLASCCFFSEPSVFCSMEEITLQELLLKQEILIKNNYESNATVAREERKVRS